MSHARTVTALLALLALNGCKKELDKGYVTKSLFQDKGTIGGLDIGASWDDIKKNHDSKLEVRDEAGFEQLRYDLGDPGDDGFYLGFAVGPDKKVTSLGASVYGRGDNAKVALEIAEESIQRYDQQYGKGTCRSTKPAKDSDASSCEWPKKAGLPKATLRYLTMKEPVVVTVDISFSKDE